MYFYSLKMPETTGLGTDICFLGAKEELSMNNNRITSTTASKLSIGTHQIWLIFNLDILWGISSFFWRV